MNILFYLSIVLFFGFAAGKIVSLVKLPSVTGYLLAGLLIGPHILGFIPEDTISNMEIISEVALGMIAFSIGSQFSVEQLKKLGSKMIVITIFEAMGAFVGVLTIMLLVFKQPLPFSIVIASIATATAPAVTLMVVRQYKAKGPVVDTLLSVVAMDDAVCIIAFSISSSIAKTIINPGADTSVFMTILNPILEIFLSIIVGIAGGLLVSLLKSKVKNDEELLVVSLGTIFLTVALSKMWNLSELIACMVVGSTIINLIPKSYNIFNVVDRISLPIYVSFFTLSGAELNIEVLKTIGLIGVGYIVTRPIGKMIGAYLGAKISKMPETVQKYLGMTLIPQAGVAIGLSIAAQSILPEYSSAIRTIVLSATFIYELVGPVLTKIALIRAKEITISERKIKKHTPRAAV